MTTKRPYDGLDPSTMLNMVEAAGFLCTGKINPLNSYENRVYEIGVEDAEVENVVAKFYRPGRWSKEQIQEEHDFLAELVAVGIDVIAPLEKDGRTLFEDSGFYYCVFPKRGGYPVELTEPEEFRRMGRMIAAIHNVGSQKPYQHRQPLTVDTYGWNSLKHTMDSGMVPEELREGLEGTTKVLLQKAEAAWDQRQFTLRTHTDCHLGNVLEDENFILLDFDDSAAAPAVQDLWMFTSGEREEAAQQLKHLLDGYTIMREFNYEELSLIEALKSLRMIRYTGWIAQRWDDPTFQKNFAFFTTPNFWATYLNSLKEQIWLMDEPYTLPSLY